MQLLKKPESFPNITNPENQWLRELRDISIPRQMGFCLPGLNWLDVACDIIMIVQKLPYIYARQMCLSRILVQRKSLGVLFTFLLLRRVC